MHDNAKLSGWLDTILNTTLQLAPVAYGMYTQNQASGAAQAQQQAQVTQAIDSLVTQLNQVEVGFAALSYPQRLATANQALQAAGQVLAAFNQIPATGSNLTYLNNAKRTGQAVLAHIQTMITQAQTNAPTNQPTTTQPTTPTTNLPTTTTPNGQVITGNPVNQTHQTSFFGNLSDDEKRVIMYGGAAVVVLLLLK
jgi:hypothetical protein